MQLKEFIREKRGAARLTQPELAEKAGVGLRFVRELEKGKDTLRVDKINQVLKLFGYEVGPIAMMRDVLLMNEPETLNYAGNESAGTKRRSKS
jgi:y4mF family transcriptional regulator